MTAPMSSADNDGMDSFTISFMETWASKNTSLSDPFIEKDKPVSISSADYIKVGYYIIGALGILGNFLVLVVMLSSSGCRQKTTNMYITSQSVIDLFVSILLVTSSTIEGNEVTSPGFTGELFCRLWLTKVFLWGLLVSSTYNLVALTIERYIGIVHPIWHKMNFTRAHAKVSIALAWVIGLVYNLSYMVSSSYVEQGVCYVYSNWPTPRLQQVFGVITVIIQYFIPLAILIFCYGRIIYTMQKKVKVEPLATVTGNQQSRNPKKMEDHWQKAKQNTIKTLLLVALSFVLCWSWNQVYFTLFNLGYPLNFSNSFYHFTVIAVFCNCCINPFIYALKYGQFQQAARRLLVKCSSPRAGNAVDTSNTTTVT